MLRGVAMFYWVVIVAPLANDSAKAAVRFGFAFVSCRVQRLRCGSEITIHGQGEETVGQKFN